MRKSKVGGRVRVSGGDSCILAAALVILVLVYGGLTIYILNRGEFSRRIVPSGMHQHSRSHESDLAHHPHLQHHDLSSLLLEGLPPLRSRNQLIPSEVMVSVKKSDPLDVEIHKKNFKKLPEFSAAERATYLRRRMPLD